ncbi:MAG: apolipoprotein N-acyltransferase [Clostridia bacterium]|nr:apolipoprotein N-acyltransferase [Clostridia bacterium]
MKPPAPAICFACGLATGLCLLFAAFGFAVFVLSAPALAFRLREDDAKRALGLCAAFCFGLCAGGYCVAFRIRPDVAPNMVFGVDLATFAGACLLHGTVLTAGLWCGARLPCRRTWRWAVLSICWALSEWACGIGALAWPTLRLGLALWRYPVFLQTVRTFGSLFAGALVMAVNVLLAQALCRMREKERWAKPLIAAIALFALNAVYGIVSLATPSSGELISVAAVQPGQPGEGQDLEAVYDASLKLAQEAAKNRPALLLTPENSTPTLFYYDADRQAQWGEVAQKSGGDLLLGGVYAAWWDGADGMTVSPMEVEASQLDEQLANGERRYSVYTRSAAYLFGADGALRQTYQKQREVPLFENGQGRQPFQWKPVVRPGLLSGGKVKIGVLICYESLFSSMARRAVNEGAEILAVTTNDARFDADAAKGLHLAHGICRALETGRPLIQAGRNGYTAVIDDKGRITASLPPEDVGVLHAQARLTAARTPYLLWGDGWLALCAAACAGMVADGLLQKKKENAGREAKGEKE